MSRTQYTTYFQPFIDTTLGGGALQFTFPNPIDDGDTTIEARFVIPTGQAPYTMAPFHSSDVIVSFTLEELSINES